ncbi:hypothetical protein JXL19_00910 [bacterium]|nr:hypothetical protein [bacterium]
MKLKLDFESLESQWKARQIDLFPWLDGLFALIRTRKSLIRETEKRLSSSTHATMVQFLSSDDRDCARVARQIIKKQDHESLLPILLYSLEKIEKKDYPRRVMESLLDFNPNLSFGYLLGYLNLRQMHKDKVFQMISGIFQHLDESYPSPYTKEQFFVDIFYAIRTDLEDRMPSSKILKTMEDFEKIVLDLRILKLIYKSIAKKEDDRVVEDEMRRIGREVVISLKGLSFKFDHCDIIIEQISDVIPYMALMRLDADLEFLEDLPSKIKTSPVSKDEKEDIIDKAKAAIKIIEQPERCIQEILDELEAPPF